MMMPIKYYGKIFNDDESNILIKDLHNLNWVRIANTPRSEYYANDFKILYSYGIWIFTFIYVIKKLAN